MQPEALPVASLQVAKHLAPFPPIGESQPSHPTPNAPSTSEPPVILLQSCHDAARANATLPWRTEGGPNEPAPWLQSPID